MENGFVEIIENGILKKGVVYENIDYNYSYSHRLASFV